MNESTPHVSEEQLLNALKTGEDWAFKMTFSLYKSQIARFVVYHHGSKQEGEAIFREALMIFYEKICRSSFRCKAKIRTYLMAIARNLWEKKLVERGEKLVAPRLFEQLMDFYQKENFEVEPRSRVRKVLDAIEELDSSGKELLTALYFYQLSPEIISRKLGIESEEQLLNYKNQCISNLKLMVDRDS